MERSSSRSPSSSMWDFTPETRKQIRFYVTTGASIFTALAMFETLKFQSRIFVNKKKCRVIEQGQASSPEDVKDKAIGSMVMVSGVVDTINRKQIVQKVGDRKENLALYLRYREAIFSNQSYDLNKNDYHINLREVLKGSHLDYNTSIVLKNMLSSVSIKNIDKIDFSPALDILKWQTNKRNLTLFENINVMLMAVLRGVATIGVKDNNVTFLRGINVGHRQVESGIRIGATLTVLGTLGVTTEGQIFIEPVALFKERLSFLDDLRVEYQELITKRNVWFGLLLIGGVYVGRRVYNYVKKNNIRMLWDKRSKGQMQVQKI